MANVILKSMNKIYSDNGFHAVKDVCLDIKDGEFMVLVGPSGCAKSTLLRMVAGLETISSGELLIGDKLCNELPPKDRGIAMVFQNYALYPHMTVYENMAFGLETAKKPKHEIDARVKEAANLLEITEMLDRKPKQMSGGQRQRVALGRAMVRKPDVFLFDEPLSNLDAKLRVSMRMRITRLHKDLRDTGHAATMIYVTHDQVEAMTMGDRVCVLNKGEVMQVDTPMNVYHNPKNKFVAEFIGSPAMNMQAGKLIEEQDSIYFETGKNRILIPKERSEIAKPWVNKTVVLGIRPEHLSISKEKTENTLSSFVTEVELLGSEIYLHTLVNGENAICKLPNNIEIPVVGDSCELVVDGEQIHLFEDVSGQNIFYKENL